MRFEKRHLGDMFRCYSTGSAVVNGETVLLLASEAEGGSCVAYSGAEFETAEALWTEPGGTMSIIEHPDRPSELLISQRFYPGFQAEGARIVWARREQGWIVEPLVDLPYVHRFDLIKAGETVWFLGATLCSSKKEREDWSDPGKVYVGVLPAAPGEEMPLRVIAEGLTRNHGYCRAILGGRECALVTSDSGILACTPPETPEGEWRVETLLEGAISDVAAFDLDGDGLEELITIEPFHGATVRVYHKEADGYRPVYDVPGTLTFAHAVWAGRLRGQACALLGVRRAGQELFRIRHTGEGYVTETIDQGGGPSNVFVVRQAERDLIVCANHTLNEAAVYIVTEEESV